MTILRMAGYCFSGRDFDGIQVVNPNLTGIVLVIELDSMEQIFKGLI